MTETELTPLIWERDGDNRYAQDGDSGYYSITKGERLFGRDTFRLQFTPREEYDKPNPQRRSAFQHMSPELAEQHAEEDRLYRIREAERAERAAKCTIKIPTLSWIPADGGFISDPPGYIVRLTEAGRYNIEHNGRIASSFADFGRPSAGRVTARSGIISTSSPASSMNSSARIAATPAFCARWRRIG